MTKDETIDKLWEQSNHGTRREDVVAALEAGAAAEREACAKLIDKIGYSHTAGLSQFVSGEFAKAADAIRMRSNAKVSGVPPQD